MVIFARANSALIMTVVFEGVVEGCLWVDPVVQSASNQGVDLGGVLLELEIARLLLQDFREGFL